MIVANPSAVRAIAEAKIKTDKIDARMLASLLRVGLDPELYVPSEEVRAKTISPLLRQEMCNVIRFDEQMTWRWAPLDSKFLRCD